MALDIKQLIQQINDAGQSVELQEETNQAFGLIKTEHREFPFFARIYEGEDLVQFICFIPCEVKKGTEPDLGRLLHLFNKELDIPGFGMDEQAGVIYFRCMIPTVNRTVDSTVIKSFLQSTRAACENFGPAIEVLASGQAKFEEMLAKAQAAAKEQAE